MDLRVTSTSPGLGVFGWYLDLLFCLWSIPRLPASAYHSGRCSHNGRPRLFKKDGQVLDIDHLHNALYEALQGTVGSLAASEASRLYTS